MVFLPSAEGVASPQELAPAGGDHPSFLEVGEAAPAQAVAKSRIADALDPTKQNTLKVIEKLMEAPIIDPRQEKAYKTAAVTVDKVKNHIKSDLMKVVQMEILSQRVNELDAKKAMGLSGDVEHWLKQGATAMDTAIKSGAGCEDSHPGLCAGVQVQGHCGIKDYQQACPLSCHLCAMPPTFRLQNTQEASQKKDQERAGKQAALVAQEKDNKKIAAAARAFYTEESKGSKANAKVKSLRRKIANLESKLSTGKAANERNLKRSQVATESNKAKAKATKEAVQKKKKLKVTKGKADKTGVKTTKMLIKDEQATMKRRQKELKKARTQEFKDNKALSKLNQKKSEYEGAMAHLRSQKKELNQKSIENVAAKAKVHMSLGAEKHKRELAVETEQAQDKIADARMLARGKVFQKKLKKQFQQEAIAKGEREKLEIVSKEEQKRMQEFTAPGAERKIKGELSRADRDMINAKRKMERYRVKYGHLGLKLKIPAKLEHAYAVAKQSKSQVEELIKQLDAEQQSPAAQKLREAEVVAKGRFKKEEEKSLSLKKAISADKKQIDTFKKLDKKRRDMNKKAYDVAIKAAKKVATKAEKDYKDGVKKLKESQKKLDADEKKVAKDTVKPSQILQSQETVDKDREREKRKRKEIERNHEELLRLKTKLGKVLADVEKRKEEIKKEYATAKANRAQDIAFATAKAEKAKAAAKASTDNLKGVKDIIMNEHKLESAVMKAEAQYDKAQFSADAIASRVHVQKKIWEDAKKGEPAEIAAAKKKGEEKEKAKEEKEEKVKKEKASAKSKAAKKGAKKAEAAQATKEMLAVAKDAMKEAAAVAPAKDEKCTGSEDKHPKLCGIVKNHKHCGFAAYKDYCCGACAGARREMGDSGADPVQKLAAALSNSIDQANGAIEHAQRTESDSQSSLSGDDDVTSLME